MADLLSCGSTTAARSAAATLTAARSTAAATTTAAASAATSTATKARGNRIPRRVGVDDSLGSRIGFADEGLQRFIDDREVSRSKLGRRCETTATATTTAAAAAAAHWGRRRRGRGRRGLSKRHRNQSGQRTSREQYFQGVFHRVIRG